VKYYCETTMAGRQCYQRPALVSPTPSIHKVCDGESVTCFRVAVIPNARRGPSFEVSNPGSWGERAYLKDIFDYVLGGTCTRLNGHRKIVVDTGANIGLYGLYFATRGCFVHFIEALPLNADHIELSIDLNGLKRNTVLHRVAVSAQGNRTIAMRYMPTDTGVSHAVYGTAENSNNGYFRDTGPLAVRKKKWVMSTVPAEQLETIVRLGPRNHIDFLKIDVEGAELEAICSSIHWFGRRAIHHLGMELNWKTTVQAQARLIEALMRVFKMELRTSEKKLPHISAVTFKQFYRHEAKMYMGLFDPRNEETSVESARGRGKWQANQAMVAAAQALCAQARVMRSAE